LVGGGIKSKIKMKTRKRSKRKSRIKSRISWFKRTRERLDWSLS